SVRMLLEEWLDRRQPLGDERSFVKQTRRVEKRFEVDFDHLRAGIAQTRQRRFESLRVRRVAEEFELCVAWHAEAHTVQRRRSVALRERRRRQWRRPRTRIRIAVRHAVRDLEYLLRVMRRMREDRHAIERLAGGHDTERAQHALGRLQTDESMKR